MRLDTRWGLLVATLMGVLTACGSSKPGDSARQDDWVLIADANRELLAARAANELSISATASAIAGFVSQRGQTPSLRWPDYASSTVHADLQTGWANVRAARVETSDAVKAMRDAVSAATAGTNTAAKDLALLASFVVEEVSIPLKSEIRGFAKTRKCSTDLVSDELLIDYLKALAQGDISTAMDLMTRIASAVQCLSLSQALRLDFGLARALTRASDLEEARKDFLFFAMLPISFLVVDATKHTGKSPLLAHIGSNRVSYSRAFVGLSPVRAVGLWFLDPKRGKLWGTGAFCEAKSTRGCISGTGLLAGLLNRRQFGGGVCAMSAMIDGGLSDRGYACTKTGCDPGSSTAEGSSHGSEAGADTPSIGCGGALGGGGRGGASAFAANGACGISAATPAVLQCALDAVADSMGSVPASITVPQSLPMVSKACTLSAGGTGRGPATPSEKKEIKNHLDQAMQAAADKIGDPANQEALVAALKEAGVAVSVDDVAAALGKAISEEGSVVKTDAPDDLLGRDESGPGKALGGYNPDTGETIFDGDLALADGEALETVAVEELVHEVLYNLGIGVDAAAGATRSAFSKIHHEAMKALVKDADKGTEEGTTPPEDTPAVDDPNAAMCSPVDDMCGSSCTGAESRLRSVAQCAVDASSPESDLGDVDGTFGVFDPPETEAGLDGDGGLAACVMGGLGYSSVPASCMAMRCGDAQTPKLNGGRCTCGGYAPGEVPPASSRTCLAMDCASGVVVHGPAGCKCNPDARGMSKMNMGPPLSDALPFQ